MSDYDAACDYQYCGKWNDPFTEKSGDRLKSSILDHYALGKIFSERAVIDSGLKHWASIRQTGMYPTNIHNITVGYPIRSHIPLNNVCEWSDCDDSARLMFNICASAPEKFWNHCYNLGGGAESPAPGRKSREKWCWTGRQPWKRYCCTLPQHTGS